MKNNLRNCRLSEQNINLDSQFRINTSIREKGKIGKQLQNNYTPNCLLSKNIDNTLINKESELIQGMLTKQDKRKDNPPACLNRFETLHRDVQNEINIIPNFEYGINTRQLFECKKNKFQLNK